MTDLTLDDLASGDDGDDGDTEAESGESLLDLAEWAEEKGYLKPLLADKFGVDMELDADVPDAKPGEEPEGPPLTAENIAEFADAVTGQIGDVPLSQVAEFARENPEKVNAIIQQNT